MCPHARAGNERRGHAESTYPGHGRRARFVADHASRADDRGALPGHQLRFRLSDGRLRRSAIFLVVHALKHAERLLGWLFRLFRFFGRLQRRRLLRWFIEQHARRIERWFQPLEWLAFGGWVERRRLVGWHAFFFIPRRRFR